jgi:hypothetical protein
VTPCSFKSYESFAPLINLKKLQQGRKQKSPDTVPLVQVRVLRIFKARSCPHESHLLLLMVATRCSLRACYFQVQFNPPPPVAGGHGVAADYFLLIFTKVTLLTGDLGRGKDSRYFILFYFFIYITSLINNNNIHCN